MGAYEYRHLRIGYRDNCPSQTSQRTPKKRKVHKSFVKPTHSKSPSPATATVEDAEHHRELKEPHRTLALIGVEVDEAIGGLQKFGQDNHSQL